MGAASTSAASLKVIRPILSSCGTAARKSRIAVIAATSRDGRTSVACIEPETSASRRIVVLRSVTASGTRGCANAPTAAANASARSRSGTQPHPVSAATRCQRQDVEVREADVPAGSSTSEDEDEGEDERHDQEHDETPGRAEVEVVERHRDRHADVPRESRWTCDRRLTRACRPRGLTPPHRRA